MLLSHQRNMRFGLRAGSAALVLLAAGTVHASAHTPPIGHGSAAAATSPSEVRHEQRIGGTEVTVARHGDPMSSLGSAHAGRAPAPVEEGSGGVVAASTIPSSCPTVDRTTEDTTNAAHPASSAVIKVIYAYPTDVGNRLSTYSPVIQAGAQRIGDIVTGESGGVQSLRFDIGTSAGAGCVDVQRVALSQPSSFYTASPQSATFTRVKSEVQVAIGAQSGIRNYVVYADGISRSGIAGEGQVRFDDSANGNLQNLGNLWAILYGRGGTDFFGSSVAYAPGTTSRNHVDVALHEISHTLGAVQGSAPNRSAFNHCLDEWDILCYDDDGSGGVSVSVVCGSPYSASNQAWDCNKNDYFNPSPQSGSYLATHWNLTRSVFMCRLDQCGPGGAAADITQPQAEAPRSDRPPETTILRGPRGRRRSRSVTFIFSADVEGATFECRLDRRPYAPCTAAGRFRNLRRGRHRFEVYAVAPGGLADPTPAKRSFVVTRSRGR